MELGPVRDNEYSIKVLKVDLKAKCQIALLS